MRKCATLAPGNMCQVTLCSSMEARWMESSRMRFVAWVQDGQLDLRSGPPGDPGHHLADRPISYVLAIDLEDDVARTKAGLLRGRAIQGRYDDDASLLRLNLHADALQVALLGLLQLLYHSRGQEGAVTGVPKGIHHAADSAVGESGGFQCGSIHVVPLDLVPGLDHQPEIRSRSGDTQPSNAARSKPTPAQRPNAIPRARRMAGRTARLEPAADAG